MDTRRKRTNGSRRLLVIDARMLEPDRDYGSMRMYRLLLLLKGLSFDVTFAPSDLVSGGSTAAGLQQAGITVLDRETASTIEDHLRVHGREYVVIILSRIHVAARYMEAVHQDAPQAVVVFDTVDLHFLRFYRGAKVTGNLPLLQQAVDLKRQEIDLVRQADWTFVTSPIEQRLLERTVPGAKVFVISNVHEPVLPVSPFEHRQNLLFIGSFHHHPNVDGILHFVRDTYPLIRKELKGIKVIIIGESPPESVSQLNGDDILVTGHVPDVGPFLQSCKVSLAPLRYGAGVKGKVLTSMSYGLPVVATSCAAEGIARTSDEYLLVADDPLSFSQAVVRLYRTASLWNRLSANGLQLINQVFSEAAIRNRLQAIFRGGKVATR